MAQVLSPDVESLRTAVAGQVLQAGDPGYEEARVIWNADIDRRPAVIVRCANAADVSAAIGFARRQNLEIAVRGGAHSTAGACIVEDGLMIDLSLMREVTVDPVARRAVVGGGATLGDRDDATQAHGLATTGGLVSHTGVAGLTLGGGMGWLTRKFGLAIDNLVSAEVVTADGRIRRASASDNPDLFWAIRGGGGNFGIVSSFTFQAHPVTDVTFAMFMWPAAEGLDHLKFYRDYFPDTPPEV
ncbi:MAG: FAD-linked oxidoreductase, partial [Acidobacteria bacterium]